MTTPAMRVLARLAPCLLASAALAAPQDAFEPNDDCTAPPLLPPGQTTGLTLGPDDDFFTISVPANADIVVDAQAMSGLPLDVELLEVGCGTLLAAASGNPLTYFDCGGAARDLVIHLPDPGTNDEPYTLDVSATEVVDTVLEDNDSCSGGSLVALQSFTTPGLVVTGCDEDFFIARLQRADVQIQVDVLFSHADGDVDLEILEFAGGACTGTVLASSTTTTDNESMSYVNTTNPSMPQAVVLRVFMKNGEGYNDYALSVCFGDVQTFPLIGEQVCAGEVNSTGRPSTLCGVGSDVAADDDVDLYVVDLPASSVGYFVTSPMRDFSPNPGGSLGNLCLAAPGRYSTNVLFTGAGSVFFSPDLNSIPVAGGGTTVVGAGDTQLWQFWHRDSSMGTAVSNFSSALEVVFQ